MLSALRQLQFSVLRTSRSFATELVPATSRTAQTLYPDIEVDVTNWEQEKVKTVTLPGYIFNVPLRTDVVQRVVVWQLAKRQQGTHKAKTRAEVSGTTKKSRPQKGTGGARHGNMRAPLFRHGGRAHGPVPRSHAIDLPKEVRKFGLRVALSAKLREGNLIVLDDSAAKLAESKTSAFAATLEKMKLESALMITGPEVDENLSKSASNLRRVIDVLPQAGVNVYDIVRRRKFLVTLQGLDHLKHLLMDS